MIIADKGARLGNFFIDNIVIILLILIQYFILTLLDAEGDFLFYFFDIYIYLFYFLYYFLFEYFLNRTPGKYLTNTIVVNHSGERPNIKEHLKRSIARLIFFHDQFSYVFGQGLHDSISNTVVVNIHARSKNSTQQCIGKKRGRTSKHRL